jgi:hypothetical protein
MGRDTHDFHQYSIALDSVEDSKLVVEPRRPLALPFSEQRLVMKSLDDPQSLRSRYSDDVLPFLVALQNFGWEFSGLAADALVVVSRDGLWPSATRPG